MTRLCTPPSFLKPKSSFAQDLLGLLARLTIMPILERMRRKLSRSKSVSLPSEGGNDDGDQDILVGTGLALSPSDEQLVAKLAFTEETNFIPRTPTLPTPSVATGYSERTVFNNVDSGILSLPTELLMSLLPCLSLSAEVALRQTCSRFLHLYSTQSFLLTGQDLFEFLCVSQSCPAPSTIAPPLPLFRFSRSFLTYLYR